jgi:dTDP-4-dehydrorhamnose reductase
MQAVKTILVTGANGQLGSELNAIAINFSQYHFLFADRTILEITNEQAIALFFEENKIDVCINCAAYTAVDKAETEKEFAIAANTNAVGYLAKACKIHKAEFIHISTDYVFDGSRTEAYLPEDKTSPVNFYGQTKLDGELLAVKENEHTIIIRTAWVYSSFGNNFVKTMMRLMKERESIGVVSDQRGAPTYAADLALAIMKIIEGNKFTAGLYHYSNKGNISWHEFATEIATQIKSPCIVNPITTAQFPTPAARPAYSLMNTNKIEETFGISIPEWKVSLQQCISLLL